MRLRVSSYLLRIVVATLGCLLAIPSELSAQGAGTKGDKAVYSGTTTSSIVGSSAYVDATAFQTGGSTDICAIINAALQTLLAAGGVVDARGIQNPTAGGPLECAPNATPWLQKSGSSYVFTTTPADILLPPANICIQTPWIVPDKTRVIGVGIFGTNGTVIWPTYGGQPSGCSGNFSDNENPQDPGIIYMGFSGIPPVNYPPSPAPCPNSNICTGVVIENLQLDGAALPTSSLLEGIENFNSGAGSYIDQVSFPSIPNVDYDNFAPAATLSNLSITVATGNGNAQCVLLDVPSGVSSAHGVSCIGVPDVLGVRVGAMSTSIEDTHFESMKNGIDWGDLDPSQSDVVINATGSAGIQHVVYLDNAFTTAGKADVVLLAIDSGCNGCGGVHPFTIYDNVTDTQVYNPLSASNDTDQSVGLYVLGEALLPNPYYAFTRFSTSPSFQTWGQGHGAPSNSTPSCAAGSIYSNTASTFASAPDTIYVCTTVSGATRWVPLI